MFSKDPSELERTRRLDNEEISRSIRLALAAELDAINFYLQQSKLMPDGSFKKVHEDIAKEEVAHFGEFIRLLYDYVPEDFEKIKSGWIEASNLLGKDVDFPMDVRENGRELHEKAESPEQTNKQLHYVINTDEIPWDQDGLPVPEDNQRIIPLSDVNVEYKIRRHSDKIYKEMEEETAMRKFNAMLNKLLITDHELSLVRRSTEIKSGDWSKPGNVAKDIVKAIELLAESGYTHKPEMLISISAYDLLLREIDSTGQTELTAVENLVHKIKVTPLIRENQIIVVAEGSFKVFIKNYPEISKIGEDISHDNYVIYAKLAPMLYDKNSSVRISWKTK